MEELDGVAGLRLRCGNVEADLDLVRQVVERAADVRAVAVAVAVRAAREVECAVEVAPRVALCAVVLRRAASAVHLDVCGLHPRLRIARAVPHGHFAVLAEIDRADAGAVNLEVVGDGRAEVELLLVEVEQLAGKPVAIAEAHGGGRRLLLVLVRGIRALREQDACELVHGKLRGLRALHGLPIHLLVEARAHERAAQFVAIAENERVAALGDRLVRGGEAVREFDRAHGVDRQRDVARKGGAHLELPVAEAERGHVELAALREPDARDRTGRRIARGGAVQPDEERILARYFLAGKTHRVRGDRLKRTGLPQQPGLRFHGGIHGLAVHDRPAGELRRIDGLELI